MRKYLKEGQYSLDENDVLGKGSFGKVFRAYDHTNAMWVAIKSIDLNCLEIYGEDMKNIILNEISIMRKFTKQMTEKPCDYLVKHYDCFRTDTNIYIVMELCQGGTLLDYININQTLNEQSAITVIQHILLGLEYLDNLNISHRDLKPENIFIFQTTENETNQVVFKIGDFGFSAQKISFTEVLGTYPFMAPQIYNRESYTSKVDVWSLGIIAYQMLFNQLYYFGKNKWQIEDKIKKIPFVISELKKGRISLHMQQFLYSCLQKDQNLRLKASHLLKTPLFTTEQAEENDIFEALDCELQFCEFLREMAEQICNFGNKQGRKTEFIEIYLLKKSFAIINLLTYSVLNKQNYVNMSASSFDWLIIPKNSSLYELASDKIQKQYILICSIYSQKYAQFEQYIAKFSIQDQHSIRKVIAHENIYQDISDLIYKQQLSKWIRALSDVQEYSSTRLKLQKLAQL